MPELLPVGAYVRVNETFPDPHTYIGRIVGYDMGRSKYQVGQRYGGWGQWHFQDGGSWAFLSRVKEISEAEATAVAEEVRRG